MAKRSFLFAFVSFLAWFLSFSSQLWALSLVLEANHKQRYAVFKPSEPISIDVSIYPEESSNVLADWWVAADTSCCGWFWFTTTQGWIQPESPSVGYQGPLVKVEKASVLQEALLPPGSYQVYWGVDKTMNGLLDFDTLSYTSVLFEVTDSPSKLALQHLRDVMDAFHYTFDVYTDLSAAGNHFVMLGRMGTSAAIDPSSRENPQEGATCIKNEFSGISWGGWYFLNGILQGDDVAPEANWGTYPDAGYNLTGARKLTFWARGEHGGERVEFLAFGVGRITGEPYPDSSDKVTLCGLNKSPCFITLSKEWQKYSIDLTGLDLSYVLGGFGWVTSADKNQNTPVVFYLDDIKYQLPRLDEPRFLVSFRLLPQDEPVLINTAFVYDNALALLAFLASGNQDDLRRAKLIGDGFVYALDHDRAFNDGRLRNAYQGGDLILPPGWEPHGKKGTVRMPGWWSEDDKKWYEDKFAVSTHTGNVAWPMIALISLYQKTGEQKYLTAAMRMGEWIEANCRDERGAGGYTGGYEGWEATSNNPQGQTKLLWKSTEHNIDVYVAFMRLYNLTGNPVWKERALHAKGFVEAMWDEAQGHFWTGTGDDGVTINKKTIPVDIQAWAVLALGQEYQQALSWAKDHCQLTDNGFRGFDFNNDLDGVWFEGTAQMVSALKLVGDPEAQTFQKELERAQKEAPNSNGYGLVAASHDNVTTGFDWKYHARLHVGATAWFVFAELGYNPYWDTP